MVDPDQRRGNGQGSVTSIFVTRIEPSAERSAAGRAAAVKFLYVGDTIEVETFVRTSSGADCKVEIEPIGVLRLESGEMNQAAPATLDGRPLVWGFAAISIGRASIKFWLGSQVAMIPIEVVE